MKSGLRSTKRQPNRAVSPRARSRQLIVTSGAVAPRSFHTLEYRLRFGNSKDGWFLLHRCRLFKFKAPTAYADAGTLWWFVRGHPDARPVEFTEISGLGAQRSMFAFRTGPQRARIALKSSGPPDRGRRLRTSPPTRGGKAHGRNQHARRALLPPPVPLVLLRT